MKAKSANRASPAVYLLGGKGQSPKTRQRGGHGIQGLQPGRDGRCRPAGAAGLRAVDRFLPRLRRVERSGARQPARDARRRHPPHRARERTRLRRPAQAAAGVGAQRRAGLDARHDGDRARCRRQRRHRACDRPCHRQPAPRLGLLSSPGPELRGGGARVRARARSRRASNAASPRAVLPRRRRSTFAAWPSSRGISSRCSRSRPGRRFRRIRWHSSRRPRSRCSGRGDRRRP